MRHTWPGQRGRSGRRWRLQREAHRRGDRARRLQRDAAATRLGGAAGRAARRILVAALATSRGTGEASRR